jgi:hypothetical protein
MAETVPTTRDGLVVSDRILRWYGGTNAELTIPTSQVLSWIPNSTGKLRFAYESVPCARQDGKRAYSIGTSVVYHQLSIEGRSKAYPIHELLNQ